MGRVISRKYEELGQLGQGGQGVVYKVRHVENKMILALKALPAFLLEDQDMVSRFEQEAVLMTRLQHRNIARVLGTGRDDALNLTYFVMEYIQGRTLKQYLYEKGPLPLPEVLEITRQVASALDYAHNQTPSVIHRDIKPTNIMIEDHTGRAVVLDFGIAKELDDREGMRTKTGVMMGTWKYCSPEQLRHEPLSGSADVYSLGIVMYEIFTGKQFFAGLDEHAILGKVLYEPQENIPTFERPAPPAFAALITKAIAKDRDRRYPRMTDLLNDLEACWWALDETKTVVLNTPEHIPSQPEHEQSAIQKIEEQIRQLEEERQRRLVVALQARVREERERAAKGGARQVAEALFEQGRTQERAGEEHARNRQYPLTQQAYQEALQCFARAAEEAEAAMLWRQAEQSRQEAATASADAERYRARDLAPTVYASALTTQARAEQAWEQRQYAHARTLYEEARDFFEDARDLAYRQTLKEEAEAARLQAQASKDAAVAKSGETLASSLFEEGQASEQRGMSAFDREEFTQAREFFLVAQQKYEQGQRQALRVLQRRQELAALAEDVDTAQHRAQAEGNEVEQQDAYQQAEVFRQQATALLTANEFTRAKQLFTQAREQYQAATHAVARARLRQQATRVRYEMDTARANAEAVGAPRWFPMEWATGQQEEEVGRERDTQGELAAAIEHYRQAAQQWERLRQAALEREAQEITEQIRQQIQSARQVAQQAAADSLAATRFQQAGDVEQQAEEARARKEFGPAQALYEQARRQYEHATQEARAETLRLNAEREARERALAAQHHVHLIKEQAQPFRLHAEAQWNAAQGQESQGNAALHAQDYVRAAALYAQAETNYQRARTEGAERQRREARETLRRAAATSAQLTATVQQRAVAFGKRVETNPSYRQARERYHHAEQQFQAQEYESARQEYEQARMLYDTVVRETEQEVHLALTHAREAAEQARKGAERHEAPQRLAKQWAVLLAAEQHARASEARGDLVAATQAFQELEVEYVHLREIALEHTAQERVTLVQQQVHTAKSDAHEWQSWATSVWEDAVRQETAADRAFQAHNYGEAEEGYRHVARVYAQVKKEGEAAHRQHEVARAKAHEEEQQQRRAHLAQQRAAQSRQAVEHVERQHIAQAQYATAMQAYQAAERSLAARQWVDAETSFAQAHEQFLALAAFAQSEQAKRLATTAREEALAAQQDMQQSRTPEFFPQQVAEIKALLRDSEQEFQRTEFTLARNKFRQGIEQLQQLARATTRQLQKERAEQVKAQALALQSQLPTARGAHPKQAKKAIQQGDHLFAQEHYQEATSHYETALTLWTTLQQTLATVPVPEPPPLASPHSVADIPAPVSRTNVGYMVMGGVVFILLAGLYVMNPFHETSPHEAVQQSKTPLVTPQVSPTTEKQQPTVQHEVPQKERAKTETVRAPVPTPPPPPTPQPLQIAQATPDPTGEVAVDEGKGQPFAIVTDSAAPATLRYVWQVNGKEVFSGTGQKAATWVYRPGFDEGSEQPKTVEVVVTDQKQQSLRKNWSVQVRNINRAPRLLATSPQPGKPVTARAGEVKEFTIEASDPDTDDRLAYAWSLDGKEVARENRWQFHIPLGGRSHKVAVTVSDQGGAKLQQEWLVSLKSPPPTIMKTMPASTQEVVIEEGKAQTFAVVADNAGAGALRYSWRVDGQVQTATGPQWTYIPGFSDGAEQPKQIKVSIIDRENQTVTETWQVRVHDVNRPPSIVRVSPDVERSVEMSAGEVQDFTVKATDPDRDDRLAYAWSLDGQEVARSERWQFRAPATPGSHQVRVEIQDREGMKQQHVWQVRVKAAAPPPEPPVTIAARPPDVAVPPPPAPEKPELREAEVRDWLESYRRTWESKNTTQLVSWGLLSAQDATKLQQVLTTYNEFRVALSDVDIQAQGAQATVSFKRVDTMDRNTVAHPNRTTILLEKRSDGRIVVRK